ncbi:histidine phosphatase family protein [Hyphomicrobium methylovorum]|nr:histidine phosphatase family protein [Hyphomicrobium methylovorum]
MPLVIYAVGFLSCRYAGLSSTPVVAAERTDSGPARILLMRHAEKTGDQADMHLSEAGKARAERLVTYIPETFGKPDFIFAAAVSKHSFRSIDTVTPLAKALGLEVHHDIEDKNFEELVSEIYSNPVYSGKTIVICWHHGKLPEIAALLGAPEGTYPSPWQPDTFNLILDFVYSPTAEVPPTVTQVVEPF